MKSPEHRNQVARFVHDGDGDGDVTNLKLPNVNFKRAIFVLVLLFAVTDPIWVLGTRVTCFLLPSLGVGCFTD